MITKRWLTVSGILAAFMCSTAMAASYRLADVAVQVDDNAPAMVRVAADEIRGYVCRLTNAWPGLSAQGPKDKPVIALRVGPGGKVPADGPDPMQNFALYVENGRQVVHGASDYATLWAAYELIESWGVGFYLGGDALPKADPEMKVEAVELTRKPVLKIRGNLPWFNFMNSPTTWNPQDYKTFFSQMAKQKANFIGFHVYDHEPFCGYDFSTLNTANAYAYGGWPNAAASGGPLMTTISPHRWWSPAAMSTGEFLFGTDGFFNRGEWGCEVGIDDAWAYNPARATRLQQQMMAEALAYARRMGLRTCIGFEVHGDPLDPKVREAFRRKIEHTLRTYPLDYFWAWQAEGRGTAGHGGNWVAGAPNDPTIIPDAKIKEAFGYLGKDHDLRESKRIAEYILLAHQTLKELAPNVRLVVSGWGGDAWMKFSSLYEGLDKVVPDDVIFSALDNIDPRLQDHVSEAYGKVKPVRERWPIPWFESDGGHARCDQTGPQTNTTGFEPLLKDTVKKGCQGALGIHWRTRNVEDVAGYLYRFGWNAELTAADFYKGYARDYYGPADAEHMQKVHLRLEEFGPQYVGAVGCVECSTPFTWFVKSGSADKGRQPNLAGHLPDMDRFPELEGIMKDLQERSAKAAAEGRRSAAIQYGDLASTIRWLTTRARVGLAIWNDSAPLEKKLRQAEALLKKGQTAEARKMAADILKELMGYDFRKAFQALATTCRTRGELGMLATANARYGRFYAAFVQRLAYILGQPLPKVRGPEPWSGSQVLTVYPVPNYVGADQAVCFDAVLLHSGPKTVFHIELTPLAGTADQKIPLILMKLGGEYHRAVFFPPGQGAWRWQLTALGYEHPKDAVPLPSGVIVVGPPAGPVEPSRKPGVSVTAPQAKEVLKIDFEKPLDEMGEVVGNARQTEGVKGKALDLRQGGYVKLTEGAKAVAFAGPFSVAFFARPEPWEKNGQMPVLLSKGVWDADGYLIQYYQGAVRSCIGHGDCLDAGDLTPGRWTHLALAYDGSVLSLYLDGELVDSREMTSRLAASNLPLRIGAYTESPDDPAYGFRGCIDELCLYSGVLSEAQVKALASR